MSDNGDLLRIVTALDEPLKTLGLSGEQYTEAINIRSSLLANSRAGEWRDVALELRHARDYLTRTGRLDLVALIPADMPIPPPKPRAAEVPPDPLEAAYERGAEARENGLHRDDNPYSDEDEREAWQTGFDEAKT